MRVTRVEQQERTHALLLDAGLRVFLRRGFLAATVEEIAADAGFTRGAVYKHFGGKEGLWQAISAARAEALLAGLRTALERVGSRAELVALLNPGAFTRDEDARRFTVVGAEYLAAIAGQPSHAAALAALQHHHDAEVTALLRHHCARLRVRPAVPLEHLVVAWGAMGGGLALLHAVDPATDVAGIAAGVIDALFLDLDGA